MKQVLQISSIISSIFIAIALFTACNGMPLAAPEAVEPAAQITVSPTATRNIEESTFSSPLVANTPVVQITPISEATKDPTPIKLKKTPASINSTATITSALKISTPSSISNTWRVENIVSEGVVQLNPPSAFSQQSTQSVGTNFLNPAISPDNHYLLIEKNTGDTIPCEIGSSCVYLIGELWLYSFIQNQWQLLVPSAIKGAWSPDGEQIVYLSQTGIGTYELQYISLTDEFTHTIATDATRAQPYWHDNQHVVYLNQDNNIMHIKLDGSENKPLTQMKANGEAIKFTLSNDGTNLAVVNDKQIWLIDLEMVPQSPILLESDDEHLAFSNIVQGMVWSHDNKYLAFATDYTISIYDDMGVLISDIAVGQAPHALNWSPDDKSVAAININVNNNGQLESYIAIANIDGTGVKTFDVDQEQKYTLAWSSDGLYMVWGTETTAPGPPKRLDLTIDKN